MSDESEILRRVREALGMGASRDQGPKWRELWARYFREEARYRESSADIARNGSHLAIWNDRAALGLSTADVEAYRDARMATVTRRGRPPTVASINREVTSARRCLQWAVEQRIIPHNPLAAVSMVPEHNTRQSRLRSEEELQRLLALADPTMRALILLQIDCGCRRGEVFAIEWSHLVLVPFARGVRPMVELWDTKNGEKRRVALSQRTYEAIDAIPRFGRYVFPGRKPGRYRKDGRTAPIDSSRHLNPDATLRKYQRLAQRAGLGHLWFHDLRHSFAYLMRVSHKASEFAVRLQGGWKTRSAFERYGIGGEEELADMYEHVDARLAELDKKPR